MLSCTEIHVQNEMFQKYRLPIMSCDYTQTETAQSTHTHTHIPFEAQYEKTCGGVIDILILTIRYSV